MSTINSLYFQIKKKEKPFFYNCSLIFNDLQNQRDRIKILEINDSLMGGFWFVVMKVHLDISLLVRKTFLLITQNVVQNSNSNTISHLLGEKRQEQKKIRKCKEMSI